MVNNISSNIYAVYQQNRLQLKAAESGKTTNAETAIENNENGDIIPFRHPESTQNVSFFTELYRVRFNSPDGVESSLENHERRYTQMLVHGMNNGTGNGNPGATGSPLQVLNAKLFNISIAFGEISNQNSTNSTVLHSAFMNLTLSLFDNAALEVHGNRGNPHELAQIRAEARGLGETFLDRFFAGTRSITLQNLRDTGMALTELAFHEAINFVYFEVGMRSLGITDVTPGESVYFDLDGNTREILSEEEFRRLMIETLLRVARENAEVYRQWAEMHAEEAERWRKVVLIASRIASGNNVPPQDKAFLMEHSPGLYMMAITSQTANDDPTDYDSVLSDDRRGAAAAQISSAGVSVSGGGAVSSGAAKA